MTPTMTGALMQRATKLLRLRVLTPHDTQILRTLVFSCGARGSGRAVVPYAKLARLSGMSKPTAVQAVRRLEDAGLLRRTARRIRAGWASRVAANLYVFVAPAPARLDTESTGLATTQGLRKTKRGTLPPFEGSALDLALKKLERGLQGALTPRGSPSSDARSPG